MKVGPPGRYGNYNSTMIRDPLPSRVRCELRLHPFERVAHHILTQVHYKPKPPRVYQSRAEEIRVKRSMLRSTLLSGSGLTEELLQFVQDCPEAAEWVKARVPPESWARLEDPSEFVLPLEPREGNTWTGSPDLAERSESPET